MCPASKADAELVHITALTMASKRMDQRTAMRDELPDRPLVEATRNRKAPGSAVSSGKQDKCLGNEDSPLVDAGNLRVACYGIISPAGNTVTAVMRAAALSSSWNGSTETAKI
jgi:hypothetical protein